MVRRKRQKNQDDRGSILSFKRKTEFSYKGYKLEELKQMSLSDIKKILPSRQRRSLERGFTEQQKKLLEKIKKTKIADENTKQKIIKTHVRDLVILPEMIGYTINVHNGKEFVPVTIKHQMLGHFVGEFSLTRRSIKHGAPGIGASKSSTAAATKK